MTKNEDKTIYWNKVSDQSSSDEESEQGNTVQLSRKKLFGEIPIRQQAFLEIVGRSEEKEVIELEEQEIIIGRGLDCRLRLPSKTVSRKHARIFFRNDEYYIEDLGSTNGTYVNDIRVVKCALRKNDLIYIGGVKILFNE